MYVADQHLGRVRGTGGIRSLVALVDHDGERNLVASEVLKRHVLDVPRAASLGGGRARAASPRLDPRSVLSADHGHVLDVDVLDDVRLAGVLT